MTLAPIQVVQHLDKAKLRRALRTAIDVGAIAPVVSEALATAHETDRRRIATLFAEIASAISPMRTALALVDADEMLCDRTWGRLLRSGPSLSVDLDQLERLWDLSGVASRMIYRDTKEKPRAFLVPEAISERVREENKRLLVLEAFAGQTVLSGRPWRHLIDASSVCNLRCRTCYQSNSQNFIYYDISSVHSAALAEVMPFAEYVNIAGTGEPLLSTSTIEIAKHYSSCGAKVEITTNGTMPSRMAAIAPYVHGINLSMDGATKPTFEAIRSGANFERTIAGVRALPAESRQKININFVVCSMNAHEAGDAIALAHDLGAGSVTFQEFHPYLPWHKEMELRSQDRTRFFASLSAVRAAIPVVVHIAPPLHSQPLDSSAEIGLSHLDQVPSPEQIRMTWESLLVALEQVVGPALQVATLLVEGLNDQSAHQDEGRHSLEQLVVRIRSSIDAGLARSPSCLAPFNMLYAQGDGEMRPCCVLRTQVGNLRKPTFDSAWNDPAFIAFRGAIQGHTAAHPGCAGCRDGGRFAGIVEFLEMLTEEGLDIRKIRRPTGAELPSSVIEHPLVALWGSDVTTGN